jgi:hypothetical protein
VRLIHINGLTGDRTKAGNVKTNRQGNFHIAPSVIPVIGDDWLVKVLKKVLRRSRAHRHFCRATRVRIAA